MPDQPPDPGSALVPAAAEEVVISFDLATPGADETIIAIFADRIARNLWVGIRWKHLVSQYFDRDCLNIAHRVRTVRAERAQGTPYVQQDDARLLEFCWYGKDPVFGFAVGEKPALINALAPYTVGAQDFRIRVAFKHGTNCGKVVHDEAKGGYLHAADDDRPYEVDGIMYCGRCHTVLTHGSYGSTI